MRTLEQRFWPKVRVTPACWIWTAGVGGPMGHACIRVGDRMVGAHRVSYELHHGAIPEGLVVRHRCDNPKCVNPAHLELGTQADNIRDMHERGRAKPPTGFANHNRKLTDSAVAEIRTVDWNRSSASDLSKKFGVSKVRVYQIRRGINVPRDMSIRDGREGLVALLKGDDDEQDA